MCGDKNKFMEFNEIFVDYSKVSIQKKRYDSIRMEDGSHQFIDDVYYISTIKKQYIELETIIWEELWN